MSADSGLAVFADIANYPAYKEQGLSYSDLCQPFWLEEQIEVFWGFWGACHNDFRQAIPHEGYTICKKWKDYVDAAPQHSQFRQTLAGFKQTSNPQSPFSSFVFTSNIDNFSLRSGLGSEDQVYEIHGEFETFQCSRNCNNKLWRAPSDYSFDVDEETRLARPKLNYFHPSPADCPVEIPSPLSCHYFEDNSFTYQSFSNPTGFPICPDCKAAARPSILMFNDQNYQKKKPNHRLYYEHLEATLKAIEHHQVELVIVEVGCGKNVPTVRAKSEGLLKQIAAELPEVPLATLIRINPDHPDPDYCWELRDFVIPIQSTALEGLRKIDEALRFVLTQEPKLWPLKKVYQKNVRFYIAE